jgi:hypothetical protein
MAGDLDMSNELPEWFDYLDAETLVRVKTFVKATPRALSVMNDVALNLLQRLPPLGTAKKRRLSNGNSGETSDLGKLLYVAHDVSFQIPRKKLDLIIFERGLMLCSIGGTATDERLRQVQDGKVRQVEQIVAKSSMDCVLILPTPNKKPGMYSVACWQNDSFTAGNEVLFSFDETANSLKITDANSQSVLSSSGVKDFLMASLSRLTPVVQPAKSIFESAEPTTKLSTTKTTQFHVNCYIGSKSGELFFLESGVFYGFKKPLLFIHHQQILAMEIENITSRTFDLLIKYNVGEVEVKKTFSMVAYCEYQPITDYAKKYRLNEVKVGGLTMAQVDQGRYEHPAIEPGVDPIAQGEDDEDESTDEDYIGGSSSADDGDLDDDDGSSSEDDSDDSETDQDEEDEEEEEVEEETDIET